jgi:hypothetical protein
MMQASNVFSDLEIPVSNFMDGEREAIEFKNAVFEAAEKLEKILDEQSTPASQIEAAARDQFKTHPEFKTQLKDTFGEALSLMYLSCDELPLPVVAGLADALRKLANDLDNTINDRSKKESLSMTESITDKKLAHTQHKRLRESWDPIRKVIELMFGLKFQAIKSRPGNFSAGITKTTAYYLPGSEDPLYNPFAVARLLDVYYDGMTMMDVIEYCEKHPELVTMKIANL